MSTLLAGFLFLLSLVVLYFGAELALSASEKLGKKIGMSPLVIGLILIGMGTSLPELFVSHIAASAEQDSLALGGIMGSNIANLFFVLAIAAMVAPIPVSGKELTPMLILHGLVSLWLFAVFNFRELFWWTALPLLVLFAIYLFINLDGLRKSKIDRNIELHEVPSLDLAHDPLPKLLVFMMIGFALLYAGGELLVTSGTELGTALGISTYVISALFVAFGTSFPELMTSLLAAYKKKDLDLILGNIIGSNVFNVALILGSLFPYELRLEGAYRVETAMLSFVSPGLYVLLKMKKPFGRILGSLSFLGYAGLVVYWFRQS